MNLNRAEGQIFLFWFFLFSFFLSPAVLAKELPVHVHADYLKYNEDEGVLLASGEATIALEGISLSADRFAFDLNHNVLTAEGAVRFKVGQKYEALAGQMVYDVTSEESSFLGFKTVLSPSKIKGRLFLSAEELQDQKEQMKGKEGEVTTCDFAQPHYEIMARRIEYFPDDKIIGYNVTFWVGRVPILWSPVYIYSLKKKRQHMTVFGNNEVEGDFLKTTWDYYLNPSAYGIVLLDYMSKKGYGYGLQHEYQIGDKQDGIAYLYHVDEKDTGLSDWVTKLKHRYKVNPATTLGLDLAYSYMYLLPGGRVDKTANAISWDYAAERKFGLSYGQSVDRRAGQETNRFSLSHSIQKFNTSFTYDTLRHFSGFSEDSSHLAHAQPFFMAPLMLNCNVNYKKRIDNLTSPADERMDPDVTFTYRGPFYTVSETQNWYLDLDQDRNTGDINLEYLEKQPEVSVAFDTSDLKFFKLTPTIGCGWYHEAKYLSSLTKLRNFSTHRYWLDLGASQTYPLQLGSTLEVGVGFLQRAYDPGDAQYTASGKADLKTDIFSFIRNKFTYEKKDTGGHSPFFFDRLGAYAHTWKEVLDFYYLTYFAWNFTGGYNYLTMNYDDIKSTLNFKPIPRFGLTLSGGYRVEEKDYLDLVTEAKLEPIEKWFWKVGSVNDINRGYLKRADSLWEIELGEERAWEGHWRLRFYNEYDVFRQQIVLRDLMVVKDLHCWEFKFTYSDYSKAYGFSFSLKALPDEPLGWATERGFFVESFDKEKAEYLKTSPSRN